MGDNFIAKNIREKWRWRREEMKGEAPLLGDKPWCCLATRKDP